MSKSTKVWYAVKSYDFGGMNNSRHFAPLITEYENRVSTDGSEVVIAKEVKAKQVTMPNGRKAKLFEVDGQIWARYKDGSACPNYIA